MCPSLMGKILAIKDRFIFRDGGYLDPNAEKGQ